MQDRVGPYAVLMCIGIGFNAGYATIDVLGYMGAFNIGVAALLFSLLVVVEGS